MFGPGRERTVLAPQAYNMGLYGATVLEREMKMLKKCLFAIAVIALLAVTVQAASTKYKGDPYPWPVEWKKVEICRIPVFMEVGFWVEIKDCEDKEILLKQVNCETIGKNPVDDFPCYLGCVDLEIRTNFEAELSGDLSHSLDMKHKQLFNGDEKHTLPGDGKWIDVEACVNAYDVELWDFEYAAGTKSEIGKLKIKVKPKLKISDIYPPDVPEP